VSPSDTDRIVTRRRADAWAIHDPGAGRSGQCGRGLSRDARLNRDVAIRVIPSSVADNPETLARFERESHAIAALSHPNILTIFEVGHSNGHPYAVMELLKGETLRARISQADHCRFERRSISPRSSPCSDQHNVDTSRFRVLRPRRRSQRQPVRARSVACSTGLRSPFGRLSGSVGSSGGCARNLGRSPSCGCAECTKNG
jgi:hypothetical protein